jgi:hypothetical protein
MISKAREQIPWLIGSAVSDDECRMGGPNHLGFPWFKLNRLGPRNAGTYLSISKFPSGSHKPIREMDGQRASIAGRESIDSIPDSQWNGVATLSDRKGLLENEGLARMAWTQGMALFFLVIWMFFSNLTPALSHGAEGMVGGSSTPPLRPFAGSFLVMYGAYLLEPPTGLRKATAGAALAMPFSYSVAWTLTQSAATPLPH